MAGGMAARARPASGAQAKALVILAHGYGSNAEDLISLAPEMARWLPDAEFVSPNAPHPVPGYPGGYQWFPISRLDPALMASGVRSAAGWLDRFIDAELKRSGLPESACALVGFSQGTMMSLHVGLRRARTLAALVGFSGLLTAPERLAAEIATRPPVFLAHGDRDDVVPVHALAAAREGLASAGVGCRWAISPGLPHAIAPEAIATAGRFLRDAFAGRIEGWSGPAPAPEAHKT